MKNKKFYTLILLGVFFSVIICAALFFSYSAFIATKRIEKNFGQSFGELEQEVSRLKAQLATAKHRAEINSAQTHTSKGSTVPAGSKKDTVVRDASAIRRLEKIVASTGLEQLAASQNMDPTILSEIYDEYADRKQVDQRRQQQLENNRTLHQADADRYGEELMALYEKSRVRRRGDSERQASDSAFAELLAKYPEANATGMAIAERALVSGFRRNTSEVEKYYDLLRENENFSHIVTDRGVEAMPNVEYYLARQYLRQGNRDDAMPLIQSLEINYPDSLLFMGRSDRSRRWQSVTQVIGDLRIDAELAR